jgi:hypothetical protein
MVCENGQTHVNNRRKIIGTFIPTELFILKAVKGFLLS